MDILKLLTESKNSSLVKEGKRCHFERRENGSSKEKLQRESGFKEILAEVKQNNIASINTTDDTIEIREKNKVKDTYKIVETEEGYDNSEINHKETPQLFYSEIADVVEVDPVVSNKVGKLLKEALKEICKALNLKTLPIEEINFVRITDTIEEQFSEILFLVGKIIEDIENGEILPEDKEITNDKDSLLNTLLSNRFKIELAFNILGISESVQKKVDERNGVNGYDGLPKAIDPLQLKMPPLHSEKIFNFFSEMEKGVVIGNIIEKIKQLIRENNIEFITQEKEYKIEEFAPFDSKTYRGILKIDNILETQTKNEKSLEGGIVISTDNKNQVLFEENSNNFEESILNRENLLFTNSKGEVYTPQIQSRADISSLSNIVKEEELTEQITAKLKGMIKNGLSEVKILLRPESLGEVKINMRMNGEIVMAKIEVENTQVKEIMERNLPLLKEALSQHNLTIGTFQIETYSENNKGNEQEKAQYKWSSGEKQTNKHNLEEDEENHKGSEKEGKEKNSKIEFLA